MVAAECGRRVLAAQYKTFEVRDHDFTKISLIVSVSFVINIPETIEGSWCKGEVHVDYKDAVLQPSSALHLAAKVQSILISKIGNKSTLLVYTDGGLDHCAISFLFNSRSLPTFLISTLIFLWLGE